MTVLYTEADANPIAINNRRLSVIGYSGFGRALALNLRDSGVRVVVGENDPALSEQASSDGLEVKEVREAAQESDTKLLMYPDEVLAEVYMKHVAPVLRSGDTLVFSSGYSVAFGFIEPPPFVDAVLIAPRTITPGVREGFLSGQGFPSFIAVEQDSTGQAWNRLLAVALATGALKAGALELTFRQEAELDLFVQQALMPTIHNLMMTAADILIKEGYPPEAALLDLYVSGELSYSLQKAAQLGVLDMLKLYPLTAQYGMLSRAERFHDPKFRRQMEIVLEEIRTGKFAQEWSSEFMNGFPRLRALQQKRQGMSLWALEQQTIELLRQSPPSE